MSPIARLTVVPILLALSLALLVGVPPVAANDQVCDHLISLPGTQTVGYVIGAPGTYCLATDVIMGASFTSGNAIEIAANYVTLDLNGHKVHGAAAGTATQAVGIYAFNRRNVTVKNGTVWGFDTGLWLDATIPTAGTDGALSGYLVEGVRAELNRIVGIRVSGANSIVRNNVVANTGSSTRIPNASAIGILVYSTGGRVLDNDILTVTPAGDGQGRGIETGILSHDTLIVGNRITDVRYGAYPIGVYCGGFGKSRDNLTSGVTIPFGGFCTDAGGNN